MNKKVLIISGSPRKGGNSDLLCDEFMRGAVEAGNEAIKIRVAEKRIGFCLLFFQVCDCGTVGSAQYGTGTFRNPGCFYPARFISDGFPGQQFYETCKNFAGSL